MSQEPVAEPLPPEPLKSDPAKIALRRAIPKWTEFARYPVAATTAVLAIAATIALSAGLDLEVLFESAKMRHGQVWRLVTSIFPHAGFFHLIFNVYWLWAFGTFVEGVYGHVRTLGLIVLLAVGSGAFEFALFSGGLGLSGVGYGLFGFLWVLSRKDERFATAMDIQTVRVFVGWFLFCIATTIVGWFPVANTAHAAGAVIGGLTACAAVVLRHRRQLVAAIVGLMVFAVWGATFGRRLVNVSGGGIDECRLGYEALEAKRYPDAVYWLREATRYRSPLRECWTLLGSACHQSGQLPEAVVAYRRGAEAGEVSAQFTLGSLYADGAEGIAKDETQAARWLRRAADAGNDSAQNSLAWLLATTEDPSIRDPGRALEYAHKARAAAKTPAPHYVDTLAAAYHANGLYEKAVATQREALSGVPETEKAAYQKRLEVYECAVRGGDCPQRVE